MATSSKAQAGKPARPGPAPVGRSVGEELSCVLAAIRAHNTLSPIHIEVTRISLELASGDRLELECGARAVSAFAPAELGDHCLSADFQLTEVRALHSIDDLGLGASAKAAAESLLKQFPADVKFTSGRRTISQQAAAMAPNIVKRRRWVEETYKDTPQRAALQKWVDDHPEATTGAAIAAGLAGVMSSWTATQQRNFSRHITGDAFDVQPVAGAQGDKIKQAIAKLPKLNWHTFSEGGLEIWHAQFDP